MYVLTNTHMACILSIALLWLQAFVLPQAFRKCGGIRVCTNQVGWDDRPHARPFMYTSP
jgi:hypothetical protein